MDEMDEILREEVPDGGFTLRVLAALPPRRARSRLRAAVIFASAVSAGGVAVGLAAAPFSGLLRALAMGALSPAALAGAALALLATWACAGLATSE
jgi:hypothetical protein